MAHNNSSTRLQQDETPEFSAADLERFHQRRISTAKRDGAIRRVECPHCGALVGEDCVTPQDYTTGFHAGRKALAGVS